VTVKGSGLVQAEVERRLKIGEGGRYLDRDRQRERALPDCCTDGRETRLQYFFQERRVRWPGKSGDGEAFLDFLVFLIEFRRCEMHGRVFW